MKTCRVYQFRFSFVCICVAKILGTVRYLCRDPQVLMAWPRLRANGNSARYELKNKRLLQTLQ